MLQWFSEAVSANGLLWVLGLTLAAAVVSYFLGCFNGAVIVSKYILRDDIRSHGSGNAGLTNFYRVFGGGLTLVVILMDVLKAVLSVLVGAVLFQVIAGPNFVMLGKFFAGTCCMVGHMFPCMFGFKGGKGILSGGVVAIMIDWRLALVVWGGFLVLSILTRYVSLGSIFAGIAFPIVTLVFVRDWGCTILATICGILIVWQHRANIRRLLKGQESKFTLHKKGENAK